MVTSTHEIATYTVAKVKAELAKVGITKGLSSKSVDELRQILRDELAKKPTT